MEEICSYIRAKFESVMSSVPTKNSVFYFVPLRSTLGNIKFIILVQYVNLSVYISLYDATDFIGICRGDWGPRPSYLAIVLNVRDFLAGKFRFGLLLVPKINVACHHFTGSLDPPLKCSSHREEYRVLSL